MSDASFDAQLEAARAYEALFVPALFGQWAPKVVEAARLVPGQKVLDVACGTGALARAVQQRVASAGYVAGLDANAAMLAVARDLAPVVEWRQGMAESMPFTDESFDAVVCQFGLMFMDRGRALREMLRVLRPKGRLVVAVWDSLHNIPAYAAEVELLERMAGSRAADALRAPFTLGNQDDLATIFSDAGAPSVTVDTARGKAQFPSIRVMVEADLRGWLPAMGVSLAEKDIGRILDAAQSALAPYVTADGRASFEVRAHLATALKSPAAHP